MEQFELDLGLASAPSPTEPNKMARQLGYGPEGSTCKTCQHLIKKVFHDKTYYKCERLGVSNGTATDIRLKWKACRLYKEGQYER